MPENIKLVHTCDKKLFCESTAIKGSNFLLQDYNEDPKIRKKNFLNVSVEVYKIINKLNHLDLNKYLSLKC